MARTMRRPPGKGGRQNGGAVRDSAADRNGAADGTGRPGDRFHFTCPLCGKRKGSACYKASWSGAERWFVDCRHDGCQGEDYPERVAAEVGSTTWELIEDPGRWLVDYIDADARRREEPAPLLSLASATQCYTRLKRSPEAMRYLREQRGLTREVIRRYALGYVLSGEWPGPRWQSEPAGFVFPIFRRGELVGARKRFWPRLPANGAKCIGPEGHPARLYPRLPRGRRAAILCEGELDALAGLARGLRVVSTTCGASLPEHLAGAFAGWTVAVVYDTGADTAAARTVERLRAAGAREAWAVDLRLPEQGDDLTDWFVTYGRDADDLRRLIRKARRAG